MCTEQQHHGQPKTGAGHLFCSFALLGKQGKRRRYSASATMAMWWIFGKWKLMAWVPQECQADASKSPALSLNSVLPGKTIILPQTRAAFLPMHFAKEESRHCLQSMGWSKGCTVCQLALLQPRYAWPSLTTLPLHQGSVLSTNWTQQGNS